MIFPAVPAYCRCTPADRPPPRLDDAFALVAGRFFRREVRVRARACLGGMLSALECKTGWSLAERAGEASPDGMQRLFTTARWDSGGVRDDVRGYVAAALGDPDGVLIGDDTGFEKARSRDPQYRLLWPARPP